MNGCLQSHVSHEEQNATNPDSLSLIGESSFGGQGELDESLEGLDRNS